MFTRAIIILLFSACSLTTGVIAAQENQPFFHNYTPIDGLPSSETYCALQDSAGFLWFGTDNGVARFDGYEFRSYGIEDGLTDVVAFNILQNAAGQLFVSTYSGRVFLYTEDRFVAYAHNEQLVREKSKFISINLVTAEDDGTLVFKGDKSDIFSVDSTGKVTYYTAPARKNELFMVAAYDHWGNFASMNSGLRISNPHPDSSGLVTDNRIWKDKMWAEIGQLKISPNHLRKDLKGVLHEYNAAYNERKDILLILNEIIYYDRGGKVYHLDYRHTYFNQILPHSQDGFWVGLGRGKGLIHVYLQETENDRSALKSDTILQGHSVSSIYYDRKGGLWVNTLDRGVFYAANPNLSTYEDSESLRFSTPISLQLVNEHTYYAGYENRRVGYHDVTANHYHTFSLPFEQYKAIGSMVYVPLTNRVYSTVGSFLHVPDFRRLKGESPINYQRDLTLGSLYYQPYVEPGIIYAKKPNDKIVFDIKSDLATITRIKETDRRIESYGKMADGREFIGTLEGLYEVVDSNETIKNNLGFPELDGRVVVIHPLINGGTLFGTRGSGLVYVNGDHRATIREKNGLASDIIRRIHQSENGDIWIATLSGLSKLVLSKEGKIEEIRSFYREHGLASNEILYIDSYENQVWLATGNGVVRFIEPPVERNNTSPIIRWIQIDSRQLAPNESIALSAGQQDVKIAFSALNFQMLGNIHYRYRLNQNDTWKYTKNRIIEYPNLGPGEYRFEVQSQNQDRYWSASTVQLLSIPEIWYRSWWARLLLLGIITGVIAGIFALRERRRRREAVLNEQIDELERAAVQAQMNPHFVFNSLNSIQYFILQNNTREAVYYLSRFASLIRQTLRASVKGVHSLKEEIVMLEIYLSLEKLRFKDSFDYRISYDPDLPTELIRISPMLVQPFVENAILHGMAEVESGGLITVDFRGDDQEITVTVEDNGCGFDHDKTVSSDSMGTKITRKRLHKNDAGRSASSPDDRLSITPRINDRGQPEGTRVVLKITPL